MSEINLDAAARREEARQATGEFGTQPRTGPVDNPLAGVTTTADRDYLTDSRGLFIDGYTSEDIDEFAGNIESVDIICVWDDLDEDGTHGDSQIYGRHRSGGPWRELSQEGWEYLFEADSGGDIPDFLLASNPTSDHIDLDEFAQTGDANYSRSDSRDFDDEDDESAGECDRCGAELSFAQVTDGYCPDCDDESEIAAAAAVPGTRAHVDAELARLNRVIDGDGVDFTSDVSPYDQRREATAARRELQRDRDALMDVRREYGLADDEEIADTVHAHLAAVHGSDAATRAMNGLGPALEPRRGDYDAITVMPERYVGEAAQSAQAWRSAIRGVNRINNVVGQRWVPVTEEIVYTQVRERAAGRGVAKRLVQRAGGEIVGLRIGEAFPEGSRDLGLINDDGSIARP